MKRISCNDTSRKRKAAFTVGSGTSIVSARSSPSWSVTTTTDALVREGVPTRAITVIGKGESQLLVPTGDNVREPQNRRVEIVVQ
jgi:hypothetical protein